jgi:hypothetical protein
LKFFLDIGTQIIYKFGNSNGASGVSPGAPLLFVFSKAFQTMMFSAVYEKTDQSISGDSKSKFERRRLKNDANSDGKAVHDEGESRHDYHSLCVVHTHHAAWRGI